MLDVSNYPKTQAKYVYRSFFLNPDSFIISFAKANFRQSTIKILSYSSELVPRSPLQIT